jgi:type VI secretion system secreted protein VgrG
MAYTQQDYSVSVSTPLGKDKLLLRRMHGHEQISVPFHLHLDMASEDHNIDFASIVGQGATVTIALADGSQRHLHGIVTRFAQGGRDDRFSLYRAELRPRLWLLSMNVDCRIFQNQSVPDIIEAVFSDLGFTDYTLQLSASYQPMDYCVQYNESAFAFVSRLMESAGIFYFFTHEDGNHTLVMADGSSAFQDCPGADKVQNGTYPQWVQQNTVFSCTLEESLIPQSVAVDDFSFETPSTDLLGSSDSTVAVDAAGIVRRIYTYPAGFTKKDQGSALADLRIQEHETPRRILRGQSYCRAFVTGHKTTIEGHHRSDINTAWVLGRIEHDAERNRYTNSFEAYPADIAYRPPRITPRPMIPGTQTALVVGKSGEEIWTDAHGRIKVQFHWDQRGESDENSSCWIRVAQGWAGQGWGQIFLPRVGQEVVVSFVNGDPDRPLVTGSVYNAEQTVPYALPDEQTKSTIKSNSSKGGEGANEIHFEDKKDSEEIYIHAQKDMTIEVENDRLTSILHDEILTVKNSRTVTIQEADETLTVEKGNRTIAISEGDETHTVDKGKRSVSVENKETHTNNDDFAHTVAKNYVLTIEGDLTIDVTGAVTIKSGKDMSLQAGQNLTAKASQSLTNQAGTSLTNKAGTDLTNEAGTSLTNKAQVSLTNKASASQTVDGGGMLMLKGGLIKIN